MDFLRQKGICYIYCFCIIKSNTLWKSGLKKIRIMSYMVGSMITEFQKPCYILTILRWSQCPIWPQDNLDSMTTPFWTTLYYMVLLAAAVSTPCRLRMKMMLESSSIEGCCHYHHYLPKNIERGREMGNFILLFHLLLESDTEKNGQLV